jgi:hypothetical protein
MAALLLVFSKKKSSRKRWLLQQDEHDKPKHVSDSTTQVGQDHVATAVLLVLGANNHRNLLEDATERATRSAPDQHRSDWSLSPVRPVSAGQIGLDDFHIKAPTPVRPVHAKKLTSRTPKQTKLKTAANLETRELTKTFTRAKPNRRLTLVRPVEGTG